MELRDNHHNLWPEIVCKWLIIISARKCIMYKFFCCIQIKDCLFKHLCMYRWKTHKILSVVFFLKEEMSVIYSQYFFESLLTWKKKEEEKICKSIIGSSVWRICEYKGSEDFPREIKRHWSVHVLKFMFTILVRREATQGLQLKQHGQRRG